LKGLVVGLVLLVLVPAALGLAIYLYTAQELENWVLNPEDHYNQIKAIVNRYPTKFTDEERSFVAMYNVTSDISRKALKIVRPRLNSSLGWTLAISFAGYLAMVIPSKPWRKREPIQGEQTYPIRKIDLDIEIAKSLSYVGGPVGVVANFFLNIPTFLATSVASFVSMYLFALTIILGFLARGALSAGIKKQSKNEITIIKSNYLRFWWFLNFQLFGMSIGFTLLIVGLALQ